MFRNLQTKLKYDHGLILQRVCIRLQGSPDDLWKDRGYAARHIAPEAEIHNGAVPGPAPARIGHQSAMSIPPVGSTASGWAP